MISHSYMARPEVRVALLYGDTSWVSETDLPKVERFRTAAIDRWGAGFWTVDDDTESDQGPCEACRSDCPGQYRSDQRSDITERHPL